MGRADFLQLGDWNVQCYQCGRKRKGSTMKKHWQGYWVCPEHWEPRHPQDFVRNVPDDMTPPWSQPQPEPVFTIPRGTVDNLPLQEQFSWTMIWERTLSDGFSLVEGIASATGGVYNEFTMSDSVRMDVSQNPQEALGLTELVDHQVFNATQLNGFVLNGLAVNSNNLIDTSFVINDSISISEATSDASNLTLADGLTLTESTTNDIVVTRTENLPLVDSADYQIFTATQLNGFALNGLAVNSSNLLELSSVLGDTVVINEALSKSTSHIFSDGTTLTDVMTASAAVALPDSTALAESMSFLWRTGAQLNGLQLNGASVNAN